MAPCAGRKAVFVAVYIVLSMVVLSDTMSIPEQGAAEAPGPRVIIDDETPDDDSDTVENPFYEDDEEVVNNPHFEDEPGRNGEENDESVHLDDDTSSTTSSDDSLSSSLESMADDWEVHEFVDDDDPIVYTVAASGDTHGDTTAMMNVVRASKLFRVEGDAEDVEGVEFEWIGRPSDRLVLTGDYVDRGPNSYGVLMLVQKLEKAGGVTPKNEKRVVALLGNHEITNLINTDRVVRSYAGWVHPLELKNYAPYQECVGGARVDEAKKDDRLRAIDTYWEKYEECKAQIEQQGGNAHQMLNAMPFQRSLLGSLRRALGSSESLSSCPPFSALGWGEQRLVGEALAIYENSWSMKCDFGAWLRSHDAIAKIGDAVYMHAGLKGQLLRSECLVTHENQAISVVNSVIRRALTGEDMDESEEDCAQALLSNSGVVWWRPIRVAIQNPFKAEEVADDIKEGLAQTGSNRMVVGHDIHSDRDYITFTEKMYSSNLQKLVPHTILIGIDIGQSHYISEYGNVYGPPGKADKSRASVLLTNYHQSRAVTVRQYYTVNGKPEYYHQWDRIEPEELDKDGLLGFEDEPEEEVVPLPLNIEVDPIREAPKPSEREMPSTPAAESPANPQEDLWNKRAPFMKDLKNLKQKANLLMDCHGDDCDDCEILDKLRDSLHVRAWRESTGTCCEWDGVRCNDEGRVEGLHLAGQGLNGVVPSVIVLLEHLRVLDLSKNLLEGGFPLAVFGLDNLQMLNLSHNQFKGEIPNIWYLLSHLQLVNVSSNKLTGDIADLGLEMLQLRHLDLSFNPISGRAPSALLDELKDNFWHYSTSISD